MSLTSYHCSTPRYFECKGNTFAPLSKTFVCFFIVSSLKRSLQAIIHPSFLPLLGILALIYCFSYAFTLFLYAKKYVIQHNYTAYFSHKTTLLYIKLVFMAKKQSIVVPKIDEISEIWELLTDQERVFLKQTAILQHFSKNDLIHREGEIPTHMMILVRGKVKIYKNGVGGRSQIMRMLKPFAYFGYRAIFSTKSYHGYNTNARAFEDSSVYMIPADTINRLLHDNANFAYDFIKRLSDELGASDARIVTLTQKHIRGRLAEALLFLKDNYGVKEDGKTIDILLARDDIASLSNMTTSNAIRTLSTFAEEGIIDVNGRLIKLLDEEKLKKIDKMG